MARSPLIIDTPIGRLYCIDLGGGACMLMIEQDGQAQTFPIAEDEARRIANYIRTGLPTMPGRGRPPGSATIDDEELKRVAELYTSEAAHAYEGNRASYVAEEMGLTQAQVYTRLTKARDRGYIGE